MFFTESGSNIGNATSLRGTDSAASFTVIPIHGEEMRCFSPQKTVKEKQARRTIKVMRRAYLTIQAGQGSVHSHEVSQLRA